MSLDLWTHAHPLWSWVTLLGQAEIVVPSAAPAILWLLWSREARQVWVWILPLLGGALLTLASKLAFIGWGLGIAALDFTGISGHALLAAGVYPVLARLLTATAPPAVQRYAVACGYALATLVAVSRVPLGAHSPAEAIAGFVLGTAAGGWVLWVRPGVRAATPHWLFPAMALGLTMMLVERPPPQTHGLITRLAVQLSHHATPYTRADLHRPGGHPDG